MNYPQPDYSERQQYRRKTAINVSSAIIFRLLRYPFLIAYFILVPRMMGAASYGQFALFISLLMLFSEILSFGSPVTLGKLFPEHLHKIEIEKAQKLISGYFVVWFVTSVILLLLAFLFLYFVQHKEFSTWVYIIFYFALLFEILSQLLYSVLFGLNEVGRYNLVHLFRTSLRFVFLLLFFPLLGITGAMMALLLTPFISLVYAFYHIKKRFPLKYSKPDYISFAPGFRFGIIMFTPTLFFIVQQQSGPLLLKLFSVSNLEIALFDLANQAFLVLYGLTVTIYETLIPISSKFELIGMQEKAITWLMLLLRYIMSFFTLLIFGFYFFGQQIIVALLGNEFQGLYYVLLIILLSVPFWSMGQVGYVRSVILSKTRVYFLSTVLSTISYLLICSLLISYFKDEAIAIATVFSGIIYAYMILRNYPDILLKILNNIQKVALSAIIFIPGLFLSDRLIIKLLFYLTAGVIFIWTLNKSKIIDKQEIFFLLSFRNTGN